MNGIRISFVAVLFWLSQPAFGQTTIDQLEYFIDTDPGVGNGTPVSVTAGASVSTSFTVPTGSLSNGFHRLYTRMRFADGRWGQTEAQPFFLFQIPAISTPDITAVEYFIDTDPGVGNGTSVSVTAGASVSTAFTVPTGSLSSGFHRLYTRMRFADGRWGQTEAQPFYLFQIPAITTPNITAVEYFIDTDPGVGNGTPVSVTTGASVSTAFTLPTGSLSSGFHRLYTRMRFPDGRWGQMEERQFYLYPLVASDLPQNIVAAEAFFDTDPGVNNGTPVPLGTPGQSVNSTVAITVPTLTLGQHFMYLRVKFADGRWGMVDRDTLTVFTGLNCYADADGDGYGNPAVSQVFVTSCGAGYVQDNTDCNDANNAIHPGTTETCNGLDDNCNGQTDEGVLLTFYADTDGDGDGAGAAILACAPPPNTSTNNLDCNDANAAMHLGATEVCNGLDDNCNGQTDEGVSCDDGDPCTTDQCLAGQCVHLPVVTAVISGSDGDFFFCSGDQTYQLNCNAATGILWSTGATTPAIPVTQPGVYAVTVTNGGCTASSSVTVVEVTPAASIAGDSSVCAGQTNTLTALGGVSFLWSTGATGAAIAVSAAGTFTVVVTDQYGCTDEASVSTQFFPLPVAAIAGTLEFCDGITSVLIASGGQSYHWNTGSTLAAITVGTAGTYTVTATDANGCTDSETAMVTVQPSPQIQITGITSLCAGVIDTLTATGGGTYLWNTGAVTAQTAVSTGGMYTVTVTGGNGCTRTAERYITGRPAPNITISGDSTLCAGNSGVLSALGGDTYAWSSGETTAAITVNSAGAYTVTATTSFGCTKSATRTVQVSTTYPGVPLNLVPDDLTGQQDQDMFLEWSPADSAQAYNIYVWKATENKPAQPSLPNRNANRVFYSIPNPVFNSLYYWQVAAINRFCASSSDTAQFVLRNLPDLVVTNIQVPNTLIAGETVTISYTVRNDGPGYTGFNKYWTDKVYFSDDSTLQAGIDIHLGNVTNLSALYPGETYTQSATFRIPIDAAYTGHFHVIVDAGWTYNKLGQLVAKFPQTNTANDVTASADQITVVLPDESDLQVVAGNCPLNFLSNSKISVSWTVQNTGIGRTNKPRWRDVVALVKDTTTMAGLFSLGLAQRDTVLYKDSSYQQSILSNKIPADFSGRYYVVITADAENQVWENVNETNNRKIIPVDIILAAAPDLVPRALQLPDTIFYGIPFEPVLTVYNQGFAPVEVPVSHGVELKIAPLQPGALAISGQIGQSKWLNAGDSLAAKGLITVNMIHTEKILPGVYQPAITVDKGDVVFEHTGEDNNDSTYQQTVALVPPDLVVPAVSANSMSIPAGRPLDIPFVVRNQGHPFGFTKSWNCLIYLTATPDPLAPKLAQTQTAGSTALLFAAGAQRNYTATLNLPCQLSAGTYYVWVEADESDFVFESDDTNNRSQALAITVLAGDCTYDLAIKSIRVANTDGSPAGDTLQYCTPYVVWYVIKNVGVNPVFLGFNCDLAAGYAAQRDNIGVRGDSTFGVTHVLAEYLHCNGRALMPGDSIGVNARLKLDSNKPVHSGDWFLSVEVNYTDKLNETDPANNFMALRVHLDTFVKPDLKIRLDSIPGEIVSGQPFQVVVKNFNAGQGPTIGSSRWSNLVNLSVEHYNLSDAADPGGFCSESYFCEAGIGNTCACSKVGGYVQPGPLAAGDTAAYTMTITLPASTPTGDYYLIATTDTEDEICEGDNGGEDNNQEHFPIIVRRPDPADLIATDIDHPDSVDVGKPFRIYWTLKNQGSSTAYGVMREAVYLSKDQTWSEDDLLMGYQDDILGINLPPKQEIRHSIEAKVSKAALEDYYVLVRTDLKDNIWETDNQNNEACSGRTMSIRIPRLPIGPEVEAVLYDGDPLYYLLDTKAEHLGETILVTLTTPDSVEATNQLYLRRGILPSLDDFDYRSLRSDFGNQETAIPTVENVPYYLMADGQKGAGLDSQQVKLRAFVLPFQIRSVDATKGGNTGYATVLLRGAKFDPQMQVFLRADSTEIPADSLGVVDATKAFARFDLNGQPLGQYVVHGLHANGDTATWQYYEIEPGGPPDVVTFLRHPAAVFTVGPGPGTRPMYMTLDFENRGNTDVPLPYQPVRSIAEAPMALSSADLPGSTATELQVPLREVGGPVDYLRPGAKGSVLIWVNWGQKAMVFLVEHDGNE